MHFCQPWMRKIQLMQRMRLFDVLTTESVGCKQQTHALLPLQLRHNLQVSKDSTHWQIYSYVWDVLAPLNFGASKHLLIPQLPEYMVYLPNIIVHFDGKWMKVKFDSLQKLTCSKIWRQTSLGARTRSTYLICSTLISLPWLSINLNAISRASSEYSITAFPSRWRSLHDK